ncbi:hypothetical protein ACH5RR_011814 [Cinchona calisaya]|uniref:Uncharacterized protein n=1 Tax=Cinchona calisaya TaxID=153742 RepID=A0ABD3A6K0_9GENT
MHHLFAQASWAISPFRPTKFVVHDLHATGLGYICSKAGPTPPFYLRTPWPYQLPPTSYHITQLRCKTMGFGALRSIIRTILSTRTISAIASLRFPSATTSSSFAGIFHSLRRPPLSTA